MLLALLEWYYGIDWRRLRRAAGEIAVAALLYALAAVALTWPAAAHLDEVIIGGGELGGWMWRQWWHFTEVDAVAAAELPTVDTLLELVALGRYPETGNILDILLLGYWLEGAVGFPASLNLKVLLILLGNGLCGYALARSLTRSRGVALAAGMVAIFNPLVIQDINKTGLRQVLLWWLLLYPVFLTRAWRTASPVAGALAGLFFALTAAFYWFYGLFAGLFTLVYVMFLWGRDRTPPGRVLRWGVWSGLVAAMLAGFFLTPYLSTGAEQTGQGGVARLPEVTFFLPFPAYDTIAAAPLRPSSYRENVLSSLHRTIESAWPADYVINPRHGALAFPAAAFFFGVLPALRQRRAWGWLAVWLLFFAGTLGPFLKLGPMKDTADVVLFYDTWVMRLPYAWLFQYVPGLSRMFAPYRMGSLMAVASVALVALSLDGVQRVWRRRALALLVGAAVVLQMFYRFDMRELPDGAKAPPMWRVPTLVTAMKLPAWYGALDPQGWEGIIELPLDQQQDVVCAYQSFHRQKVYRSWATAPAIPPMFRKRGGGEAGKRLRWLAEPEPRRDPLEPVLRDLSHDPFQADLKQITDAELVKVLDSGDYRYIVVHERGYYMVDEGKGATLYQHAVRLLSERLGMPAQEEVELDAFTWPGKENQFPGGGGEATGPGPAWMPWAEREVRLPLQEVPRRWRMAVFDLQSFGGRGAPAEAPVPPEGSAEGSAEGSVSPVEPVSPAGPASPVTPTSPGNPVPAEAPAPDAPPAG